jgi:hypothetical protein
LKLSWWRRWVAKINNMMSTKLSPGHERSPSPNGK